MSEKDSIVVPSIAVITSPGWMPAADAALSACTVSTRALALGLPKNVNRPAKMTIASRKLATGPATTIAARGPTFLWWKLTLRSSSDMVESAAVDGVARLALIAEEFDVAAERDRGQLPAGAVAVVEAQKFRAETDREGQDPHAGPARDQEVAKLMEEDDDRQDEQERNHIAHQAIA